MTFKFLALPLIGLASFALVACGQEGKPGPSGPRGPEGPVGPRGPQGPPGRDAAISAGKTTGSTGDARAPGTTSAILHRITVETDKKAAIAACNADEEVVSAICVARRGRSPSAQVDFEKKSARCSRSSLHMVCGKTTAFKNE